MMKKRNKIVLATTSFTLFCNSFSFLPKDFKEISIDGRKLQQILKETNVNYEEDSLYQKNYSYNEWLDDGFERHFCKENDVERDSILIGIRLTMREPKKMPKGCITIRDGYTTEIINAYEKIIATCPKEKEKSFCHMMAELCIVENTKDICKSGKINYDSKNKILTIYTGDIDYNLINETRKNSFSSSLNYDYAHKEMEELLCQGFSYVLEDFCSCHIENEHFCFNNQVLRKGLADLQKNKRYVLTKEALWIRRLQFTFLFNEEVRFRDILDILYNNDLTKLLSLFDANTLDKKEEVYHLLSAINTTKEGHNLNSEVGMDIQLTLVKSFLKNLVKFNESHHLPLEDLIYFYKTFLYSTLTYNEKDIKELNGYESFKNIHQAFVKYLAAYYNVDISFVKQRIIDIYSFGKNNIEIYPIDTLNELSKEKATYITHLYSDFLNVLIINDLIKEFQEKENIIQKKKSIGVIK